MRGSILFIFAYRYLSQPIAVVFPSRNIPTVPCMDKSSTPWIFMQSVAVLSGQRQKNCGAENAHA